MTPTPPLRPGMANGLPPNPSTFDPNVSIASPRSFDSGRPNWPFSRANKQVAAFASSKHSSRGLRMVRVLLGAHPRW